MDPIARKTISERWFTVRNGDYCDTDNEIVSHIHNAEKQIDIYDCSNGNKIKTFHHENPLSIRVSPDRKTLIVITEDASDPGRSRMAEVWNMEIMTKRGVIHFNKDKWLRAATISADSKYICVYESIPKDTHFSPGKYILLEDLSESPTPDFWPFQKIGDKLIYQNLSSSLVTYGCKEIDSNTKRFEYECESIVPAKKFDTVSTYMASGEQNGSWVLQEGASCRYDWATWLTEKTGFQYPSQLLFHISRVVDVTKGELLWEHRSHWVSKGHMERHWFNNEIHAIQVHADEPINVSTSRLELRRSHPVISSSTSNFIAILVFLSCTITGIWLNRKKRSAKILEKL